MPFRPSTVQPFTPTVPPSHKNTCWLSGLFAHPTTGVNGVIVPWAIAVCVAAQDGDAWHVVVGDAVIVGVKGVLVGVAVFPGLTLAAVPYAWGVTIATALLFYEHTLVKANDLSKLDAAFFTMNGIISLTLFAFVLAGRILTGVMSDPRWTVQ